MTSTKPNPSAVLEFQLKVLKAPVPRKEYTFALPRKWRFDFAWPELMLAVEVEGGTWGMKNKSRHTTGSGHAGDCEKYNRAAILGWKVLKYPSDQVNKGSAATEILEVIHGLQ